jgi:hypothetical protein
MKFKIKIAIPIIMLSISLLTSAISAQAASPDICSFITDLYTFGLSSVGILAALGIAVAGVMWITAAGDSGKIGEAKSWIASSLLGLALMLCAFLILNTINPELTQCGSYNLTPVASVGPYTSKTSLPKTAGYKGTLCNAPGDGSGQYWCCVIDGELDGESAWGDQEVKKCCSLEIKNQNDANQWCINWYGKYFEERVLADTNWPVGTVFTDPTTFWFWKQILYLEPGTIGGYGKNSATISAARCENNSNLKKWCIARNDPSFCAEPNTQTGASCKIPSGNPSTPDIWGYCENNKCKKCKTWGEACKKNYECPSQAHKLSSQCGNEMDVTGYYAVLGSDCASNKCDYEGK